MLFKTAARIIVHEKEKFAGAVAGVAIAVYLMILQWGFYLGFHRDITVVPDSIAADVWVIPKNQPLFDGWVSIDDLPYSLLRQHPDIASAARMAWGWAACRLPHTGGVDSVQVLGFEFESGVNLRLDLPRDAASIMRPDGHVLVGEKDREKLGLHNLETGGLEINGRRAVPVGSVPDVKLFTTASFVLTNLENARAFLKLPPSHATYLVGRCRPGVDVLRVVADLQRTLPDYEVVTAEQLHNRTSNYWAKRTSIGPILMLSAVLAVTVGFLIVMLAFYISTVEKIPVFACMKALGASGGEIASILVFQLLIVFAIGCGIAGAGLYATLCLLAQTTISVVITQHVVLSGLGATAAVSTASSLLSLRRVLSTDPGEAFRT